MEHPHRCSLGTAACDLLVMLTRAILMTSSQSKGGNSIVSVAVEAFFVLTVFQVTPEAFHPTTEEGEPFVDFLGIGMWKTHGVGSFGGNQMYQHTPIVFAPNPIECLWIGPNLNNLNCSTCVLGYEWDGTMCDWPNSFRPHKGWGDREQSLLKLQDTRGKVAEQYAGSGAAAVTSVLLTEHTYTIPAPLLEPKELMFAGYEQPYSKIHYELDFSRGSEVDIGCGTAAAGDGAVDGRIPKSFDAHPLSRLLTR